MHVWFFVLIGSHVASARTYITYMCIHQVRVYLRESNLISHSAQTYRHTDRQSDRHSIYIYGSMSVQREYFHNSHLAAQSCRPLLTDTELVSKWRLSVLDGSAGNHRYRSIDGCIHKYSVRRHSGLWGSVAKWFAIYVDAIVNCSSCRVRVEYKRRRLSGWIN